MEWPPILSGGSGLRPGKPDKRWTAHAGHDATAPHRVIAPRRPRESRAVSDGLVMLDGSKGEGGGQILRTALTLSLLTGRPFRIVKIRANRDNPGLRPQHLKAVEGAALLGHAEVEGAAVGSKALTFRPRDYEARDLEIEIGTAGATALVLHTLHLPIALKAESGVRLVLTGGTFNTKAPSQPFLAETWRAWMGLLGLPIALAMPAAGFYPRGGGRLEAWIEPGRPRALVALERPPLTRLRGVAGVARLTPEIAERMRARAAARLAEHGLEAEIELAEWTGPGPGAAIALTAEHGPFPATFVGLGERGKPAERVADEAVDQLLDHERAAGLVDEHSADQILLPLALAEGASTFTVAAVTEHLRTNARTIAAFLDRPIRIVEPGDEPARVIVG